jgi:hypothetical protein
MSTRRERFVGFIRHGGDQPFVSLQIGAGAGFDTKLAGKEWVSETTLEDTMRAYETVGGDALINLGLPDLGQVVPELAWKSKASETDGERRTHSWLETPYGTLAWEFHERPRQGSTPVSYPITFGDSLDPVRWMIDRQYEALPRVAELVGPVVARVHPEWPVCLQWSVQPFEMMCLATVPDAVLFAMTDLDGYRALCDRIRDVNIALCRAVIGGGADFIFLGGPGREMMSPLLYETFMVPDSQAVTAAVHDAGGLVYSHICSPIQPFLDMGYYGQMGIDLFETLSPPPVGNVASLADARAKLPGAMCTRGNIGLDVLLTGTPDDVRAATEGVMESTRGTKHMVAASDYLFYDIPLENAKAVVDTVEAARRHGAFRFCATDGN